MKPCANRTDWPICYGDRRPQAVNFCIDLAIKFVFFEKELQFALFQTSVALNRNSVLTMG